MSNQISDAILESIDILIDGKIKDLKFDKTVQATIFEIVDVDKGEYRVRYKDNIFLAYSSDLETVYKTGTDIYLKIPEDDMSNKKIIEGKVKSSSQASSDLGIYQETIGPEWSYFYPQLFRQNYELIAGSGSNLDNNILFYNNYLKEVKKALEDYTEGQITKELYIANLNAFRAELEYLNTNNKLSQMLQSYKNYIHTTEKIIELYTTGQITQETMIKELNRIRDELIVGSSTEILNYLKQYNKVKITADFMTTFESDFSSGNYGLIFLFSTKDNKVLSYTLDKENFVGNPYQYTSYSTQEAIIEFNPDYITGLIDIIPFENFDKYDEITIIDKDEQGNAQVITQNNEVEPNIFIQNITMQFIDNIDLTQNLYYLSIGTPQGVSITAENNVLLDAQLLYKGEDITDKGKWFWFEEDLSVNIDSAEYNKSAGLGWRQIHNASGLNLTYENINAYEKRYKVIVYYGEAEITLTKEITVYDTTQKTQYTLYYGADLQGAYLEIQPELKENINWYRILPTGVIEVLNETSNRLYISSNYLQYPTETFKVQSNDIILQSTIKNTTSIEDLVVTFEGQDLYSYDINGDITIEESEKERQLKCNLVWKEGLGAQYKIQWYIGEQEIRQNITIDEAVNNNWISPVDSMIEKAWVDADNILHYQVRQKYSNTRDNNLIKVKITSIEEKVYTYEKGITFIKVGDQGTNGTAQVLIVRPIEYIPQRDGYWYYTRIINTDGTQTVTPKNGNVNSLTLEGRVYNNGIDITDQVNNWKWQNYGVSGNSKVNSNKFLITGIEDNIEGNYLTLTVNVNLEGELRTLSYHFPINYWNTDAIPQEFVNSFSLPMHLKYSISGLNPYYDTEAVNILNLQGYEINSAELINNNTFSPPNKIKDGIFANQIILENNTENKKFVGNIVPYRDIYGNEGINMWDGKSVYIGKEGSGEQRYIYAPQIGAGTKQSDGTYTGIIMGYDTEESNIGLYGYTESIPTFGFKADGTGFIGAGKLIKFNGSSATIEGNAGADVAKGAMKLNLIAESTTSNAIEIIGTYKTYLTYDGNITTNQLKATGGQIGAINITDEGLKIKTEDNTTTIDSKGIETNFISIKSDDATGTIGAGTGNDGNTETNVLMFQSDNYSVVIETPENIRLSAGGKDKDKNIYLNAKEIYINNTTLENYIKNLILSTNPDESTTA